MTLRGGGWWNQITHTAPLHMVQKGECAYSFAAAVSRCAALVSYERSELRENTATAWWVASNVVPCIISVVSKTNVFETVAYIVSIAATGHG